MINEVPYKYYNSVRREKIVSKGEYACYQSPQLGFLTLYQTTKIWPRPKLKAFADDKSNVAKMMISVFDRVENIVGKAFSPSRVFKPWDCMVKG